MVVVLRWWFSGSGCVGDFVVVNFVDVRVGGFVLVVLLVVVLVVVLVVLCW